MARLIIFFALALAGTATPLAQADTAKHRFDIPAQPLGAALQTLADQAGVQMFYAEDSAAGKSTPALRGEYTTREAVDRLLAGTGLRATLTEDGTVTVAEAEPEAEPKPKAEAVVLPEMTVTARPDETSYTVPNATTATKTDTPIFDTPVSVQVIPQQVLKDQQAYRLEDALQNVSGVQFATSSNNEFDSFFIRGFADTSALQRYRNGVRLPAVGKSDLTNIERIEVLKGPAAMLYGRVEPGGIINLVTKKPLTEPYYSLQQEFGSYDFYRTSLDATGPLTSDRSLLYRFNLGYLDTESFRDLVFQERIFLAPSLTWRPREDTEFNLDFEYLNEDWFPDSGIPALSDGPVPIPIARQLAEPGSKDEFENYLVDFNWSHRFNEQWTLRNGVNAQLLSNFFLELYASGSLVDLEDKRTVNRGISTGPFDRDQYTVFADLTGQFQLLGMDHQVLLGADYYDLKIQSGLWHGGCQCYQGTAPRFFQQG